jgi:hypothetical protein
MDKRERMEILGQWGVRDPLPHELEEGRRVAADLLGSPVTGRPLTRRPRLFRLEADSYIASLGGPLPYMTRLREIDRLTADAVTSLESRWHELRTECAGRPEAFTRRWRAIARSWRFDEVNELIERHNRWYPVEARLPMDVRRRDYVLVNGRPYSRRPLDAAWVLERFPPELSAEVDRS